MGVGEFVREPALVRPPHMRRYMRGPCEERGARRAFTRRVG